MVFRLKISGPPSIEAAFEDFANNMSRYAVKESIDYAFKQGELKARSEVPVRTGFLRSSIHTETSPRGAKLVASAPYALYVDKRVPYFSNAVAHIQQILPGLVQQAISQQAGRIGRKYFH